MMEAMNNLILWRAYLCLIFSQAPAKRSAIRTRTGAAPTISKAAAFLGISWARPCPAAAGRAMVRGTDRAIARTIPRDIRRGISRLPRDNRAIRTSSLPLRDRASAPAAAPLSRRAPSSVSPAAQGWPAPPSARTAASLYRREQGSVRTVGHRQANDRRKEDRGLHC